MQLKRVIIKNYRCLKDIEVLLGDTTVLVGENSSGKTAFLDALKTTLPRSITRGNPFSEYDYHMCEEGASPEQCDGIEVELWFNEDSPNDWPESLVQALFDVIQPDPYSNINSIRLRLSSRYNETLKVFEHKWEFIQLSGEPIGGRGAYAVNINRFLQYVRLFYLSAIRDSADQFSARSPFWGGILKDVKIPESQRKELQEELIKLNEELLGADLRLQNVLESLNKIENVMKLGGEQKTSIQALPLKPWDLMTKSQVMIKSHGTGVDFPIDRHGNGIQNIAILFLFQAYINILLKPTYEPETEAILTLEEPEAHLHPHAVRALAENLEEIPSQTIISSHSPYFIQEIPFTDLRLFRRAGAESKVYYIKRYYEVKVPDVQDLQTICSKYGGKYSFNSSTSILRVVGKIDEDEYRELISLYPGETETHAILRNLRDETQFYLADEDLQDLDRFAKRVRGEIFFARAWLLCEGQSDYILIKYFAELCDFPMDKYGITIIDFQNNGSVDSFVSLAHAFQVPWILTCDNDEEGKRFIEKINKYNLLKAHLGDIARPIPEDGLDLEAFLVKSGFSTDYEQILGEQGKSLTKKSGEEGYEEELVGEIRKDKTFYANMLVNSLKTNNADKSRVPAFFSKLFSDIVGKTI